MLTAAGLEIVRVVPDQLETYKPGIVSVYATVFSEPPWNEGTDVVEWFADDWLPRAASLDGFRCFVATDAFSVVGFTFGLEWERGSGWCDSVARSLDLREAGLWVADAFHLVELALLQEYRGQGVGGRLHDVLLDSVTNATAILSTNRLGPPRATALYIGRGWRMLLEDWSPWPDAEAIHVMGLNLECHRLRTMMRQGN